MVNIVISALLRLLAQGLHIALMLAVAPLLVGLIRLVKARLLGRRGAAAGAALA